MFQLFKSEFQTKFGICMAIRARLEFRLLMELHFSKSHTSGTLATIIDWYSLNYVCFHMATLIEH